MFEVSKVDAKSKESNNVSISINPEIREYTESIFWGLTLRQFLFSLAGCIVSVGIFFLSYPVQPPLSGWSAGMLS